MRQKIQKTRGIANVPKEGILPQNKNIWVYILIPCDVIQNRQILLRVLIPLGSLSEGGRKLEETPLKEYINVLFKVMGQTYKSLEECSTKSWMKYLYIPLNLSLCSRGSCPREMGLPLCSESSFPTALTQLLVFTVILKLIWSESRACLPSMTNDKHQGCGHSKHVVCILKLFLVSCGPPSGSLNFSAAVLVVRVPNSAA